jgi:hypothetical protein
MYVSARLKAVIFKAEELVIRQRIPGNTIARCCGVLKKRGNTVFKEALVNLDFRSWLLVNSFA